ncbi:MAG: two-component regulator propeller domain-containing protein, partial [Bacteroidota bacterium]|nr:two-component regulator propeller domain-containing protein [Bacteroidota bacterium]
MKYKDQGEDKIFIDSGSNIWLGLKSGGLHRFNPENKKFESFDPGNDIPANIDNFKITSIIEDAKGNLWIGTYLRSVVYFDVKNHDFIYLKSIRIFNDTIFAITDICLQNDTLWIGTFDIGLVCYDLETKQSRIYNAGHSIHDLLYRNVKTLFVDRTNNLWIGSNGKGINILNHYQKPFYYLNDSEENPINISFSSIRSIYQDEDKNVWIGGYMGFEKLNLLNATTELIKNTIIYSICPDPRNKNILWLGTEGGGIYSYNKVSNDFERFVFDEYIESNINVGCNVYGLHVYDIEFKNDSLLFAGTNLGLVKINTITNSFHIFGFESNYTNSLPVGKIISIDFDSNGKLMISSGTQGIFEYNEKDNIFVRPFSGKGNFPNTYVFCIHESKNGIFWLGTDWSLCCMDTKKETYTYFTKDDGLPNNVVYAVLEDDYDNLWLSTNQGISKYNLTENKFNNFDDKDGLPGNEFNSKAFFQSDDYFYFGGVDGLVIFNPDEIFINSIPPKLAITQLKKYSNKGIDKSFAIKDDKIIIEPHENIVEIGFSTFDFIDPLSCRYMYRIQGYSDNWIELGNMHNIFLNDLNPGNYNLEIRASNSDGIWTNSPKQIELQVIPKFIETIYFKLIIFLVSLLIVIAVYFERMSIVKRQKKDLEIRIHKKTKELLKANKELNISNSTKDRFLSIIAHDLKNPFNSLLGFSEILQEEWFSMEDSKRLELVSILHKTLQETYQLLINLLDWSRLQRNKLKWQPEMVDLHEIVQNTYAQTNPLAVHKEISIIVLVNPNTQVYVDKEMISTILRNLISN